MIILEDKLNIPLDVLKFINEFMYEELNDSNFHYAINLWFKNRKLSKFKYGHISNWKTQKVTDMSLAFYNRSNFNEDISNWNVSNVNDMSYMFCYASSFNQNLEKWNITNVKNMSFMFRYSSSSNLDKWNINESCNILWIF